MDTTQTPPPPPQMEAHEKQYNLLISFLGSGNTKLHLYKVFKFVRGLPPYT